MRELQGGAHLVTQAMLPITSPKQWYSGTGMHTLWGWWQGGGARGGLGAS